MIKIEIGERIEEDRFGGEVIRNFLIVNGIRDEKSFFDIHFRLYAHFYKTEVIEIFKSYSFLEIGKLYNRISFYVEPDWWEDRVELEVYCSEYFDETIPSIRAELSIQDWEHWAKPWSIANIANQLEVSINALKDPTIKYWQRDDSVLNGFGVDYYPANINNNIGDEVDIFISNLKSIVESTFKNLHESVNSDSLLTFFKFSDETKSACMQYLVYFSQFLADLGIEVDTETKEDLKYTIFKVTPRSKEEGLEKIREALNIYLMAPYEKSYSIQVAEQNDIAIKQWEANVYHLKSQLALAQSLIQAKDATIESLQISNYHYRELVASQKTLKEPEGEDLVKDLVTVKKYEGKGFSINLPELFRRLKRKVSNKP